MTNTYSSASNAKRAAKAAGIADENIVISKADDGYTFADANVLAVTESVPFEPEAPVEAPVEPAAKAVAELDPATLKTRKQAEKKASKKAKAAAEPKPRKAPKAKAEKAPKGESKQDRLIALLKRPEGASVTELAAEFGWQLHTVRGAVAGALKRKLGLKIDAEKDKDRGGVVYRIND